MATNYSYHFESDDNITREQEADARPADLNYYGNSTLGFDADDPAPTALLVCPACHATMRFYGDFEPEFHKALTLTLEPDELVFCEACDANYGEGFALELIQEGD